MKEFIENLRKESNKELDKNLKKEEKNIKKEFFKLKLLKCWDTLNWFALPVCAIFLPMIGFTLFLLMFITKITFINIITCIFSFYLGGIFLRKLIREETRKGMEEAIHALGVVSSARESDKLEV